MKTFLPFNYIFFVLALFILICSSCGTARINQLQELAKEDSPEMFIQKLNKEIIPVTDFRKYEIAPDSILAKQTHESYSRFDKGEEYIRLMKGRMNLYYHYTPYTMMSMSSPSAINPTGMKMVSRRRLSRYFDFGQDQALIKFDRANLETHTSGCSTCLDVLKKYDRTKNGLRWWKYTNWASIAGGLVIAFTADNNVSDDSDLRIYGFTGLFFGGIFSEAFRLTRVSKNEFRLEEVVVKYNQFSY